MDEEEVWWKVSLKKVIDRSDYVSGQAAGRILMT